MCQCTLTSVFFVFVEALQPSQYQSRWCFSWRFLPPEVKWAELTRESGRPLHSFEYTCATITLHHLFHPSAPSCEMTSFVSCCQSDQYSQQFLEYFDIFRKTKPFSLIVLKKNKNKNKKTEITCRSRKHLLDILPLLQINEQLLMLRTKIRKFFRLLLQGNEHQNVQKLTSWQKLSCADCNGMWLTAHDFLITCLTACTYWK